MKQENVKIVTVSFVLLSFLTAFIAQVLFEALAVQFVPVALVYGKDVVRHGVPLFVGAVTFLSLQLREGPNQLAHEVVQEVKKVVWPSRNATVGMTTMICIILMIAGFVLGLFDLLSSALVDFIISV